MRRLVITASLLSFACGGTGPDRSIGPSPLGPTVDVRGNRITWFDPACRVQARSGIFPYRQRAWIEPRDAGGDLGVRDTLVLEYQPYDPAGSAGAVESFYFGRGAGWYEWDRGGFRDLFNRVGGPARTVAREAVCSS